MLAPQHRPDFPRPQARVAGPSRDQQRDAGAVALAARLRLAVVDDVHLPPTLQFCCSLAAVGGIAVSRVMKGAVVPGGGGEKPTIDGRPNFLVDFR